MKRRAGSAYISWSGTSGRTTAARRRIRGEHLGEHAHERVRGGSLRLLIQRRDRQRMPEPFLKDRPWR